MNDHVLVGRPACRTLVVAALGAGLAVAAGAMDSAAQAASAAPVTRRSTAEIRPVLDKYCVTCHNDRLKTGGLVLEHLDADHPSAQADVWEKVIRKVRSGAMPPMNAPRPEKGVLAGVAATLEQDIDADAQMVVNPGRPLVHRLNRAEYTNAVRDLLAVDIDGRALLPADDASYGFDNVADVLSVSTGLLERYLLVAKKVSRLALGDGSIRPSSETYKLPPSMLQDDRMDEALPFGSRGGLAVRHTFPIDGEYEIRLKLQRNSINLAYAIRGMDEDHVIDLHLDGDRVRQFTVLSSKNAANVGTGGAGAGYNSNGPEDALVVRLPVKAGVRVIGVSFPRRHWYVEGVGVSQLPPASDGFNSGTVSTTQFGKIEMGIDTLLVTGPFGGMRPQETPSRRRLLTCRPASAADEETCARSILSTLARRAYRRATTPTDVTTLMAFYAAGRDEGGFEQGIQAAVERVLVSPYFLLRKEEDPAHQKEGTAYRISDVEMASRLSFFLWSSIPDDELLGAAIAGQLKTPAVLRKQVARMLRDPRSSALLGNFFGQWLYLRNVESHKPDAKVFPEFDENLRAAFKRETELFLESQVREDHSVLDLLTANYTFVNERLARHYGIPDVYGSHFRRVTLPDGPRAGLLGQGSILMVTSYADRTSPVVRGKWLLENLLGAPPPPPPANVPPFPENKGGDQPKSVRARMELHRRNPVCASCHSRIDPLGFALENFNGVGRYRTVDDGSNVDASGTMPDGVKFNGPADFRKVLLQQREQLLTSLAEKLMTYALGRGVQYYDQPAIRRITREAAAGGDRWSALITSLVASTPFQLRRSAS